MFKFGKHCRVAASNASRAVNAMKALAGTDWCQDTETLLVTFKALVRPRLEYATPVWSTVASETSVKRLQTIQNAALRVATGNHLMAPQSHLHEETQVLPVKAHTAMLATQHLLACHLPEHPGQRLLEKPPPPQNETRTSLCPCPPSGTPPRRRWPAATNEGVPTAPENCAHREGGDDNAVVSTVWSPRYKTPSCQRTRGGDPTQTYSEDPQPTSVRLQSTPVVVPGQARTRPRVLMSPLPYSPPHDCPPVPVPHKPH